MTDSLLLEAASSPRLLLALDYDGTLVPFAAHPDKAVPDAPLLELLHRLAARPDTDVRIVSGRPRADLDRFVGRLDAGLSAEHGLWWRAPAGKWHTLRPFDLGALEAVRREFEQAAAAVAGSWMESKTAGFGWHTREAEPDAVRAYRPGLVERLSALAPDLGLELLEQHELLEIRAAGIHKGLALSGSLAPPPGTRVLAIGDDRTDEDLFAAAPPGALTVRVGAAPSRAIHRLPDVAAVRALLEALASRLPTPT